MRHLYGSVLAVVMAAVMFFAGAWGYLRLLTVPGPAGQAAALPAGGGSLHGTQLLALGALAGTAVLAGLLVMIPRISPLAAGLPGAALLAWTALYLVNVRDAVDLIPLRSHPFGAGWQGLLLSGVLGAAGAVMVFPLFVPSRWRARRKGRHAAPDTSARDADDFLSTVRPDNWLRQRDEEPELTGTAVPSLVGGPSSPVETVSAGKHHARHRGLARARHRLLWCRPWRAPAAHDRVLPRRHPAGHGIVPGVP